MHSLVSFCAPIDPPPTGPCAHPLLRACPTHRCACRIPALPCVSPQTLRNQLVPAELPRQTSRLLHLLLAQLRRWPDSGQLELGAALKTLVFQASVGALFGTQFLGGDSQREEGQQEWHGGQGQGQQEWQEGEGQGRNGQQPAAGGDASGRCGSGSSNSDGRAASVALRAQRIQDDFFAFEAAFEMAASPLPHLFQPRFLAARRRLLAALR